MKDGFMRNQFLDSYLEKKITLHRYSLFCKYFSDDS